MDIIFILLLLAVFILPSFFMMRKQNKQRQEISQLQASLQPGDRVVTAAGLHADVVALRETEVDVELAPGVVATVERAVIARKADPEVPPSPVTGPGIEGNVDGENHFDGYNRPENDRNDNDSGDGYQHPENFR